MITITYPVFDASVADWKTKLEDLVATYQLLENPALSSPILETRSEKIEGTAAIDVYIEELMEFKKVWLTGSCG